MAAVEALGAKASVGMLHFSNSLRVLSGDHILQNCAKVLILRLAQMTHQFSNMLGKQVPLGILESLKKVLRKNININY